MLGRNRRTLFTIAASVILVIFVAGCGPPQKPTGEIFDAAREGDIDQIEGHIYWKTDVNKKGPSNFTALHYAAVFGHLEIAELLLKAGADPNLKGGRGHTPLHLAASNNGAKIAEMLLKHGAKIDAFDNDKMTPYQLASISKHKETMQLLQSKGADTTLRPLVNHPRTATPG